MLGCHNDNNGIGKMNTPLTPYFFYSFSRRVPSGP